MTDTIRKPLRASENPIHYVRAYYQVGKALREVEDTTGFRPDRPSINVYDVPGNGTTAQLYNRTMIIWDPQVALRTGGDVVPHEVFHHGQHRFRERAGDPDAESRFITTESTPAGVNRASALWNGVNEAGAYIFGYSSMYKEQYSGLGLAKKILGKVIEWNSGKGIEEIKTETLDLIFMKVEIKEFSDVERMKGHTMVVVAAIILEQNHFDVAKTAKDLLQSPDKTIERIRSLSYEGALASLERASNFMLN